MSNGRDIVMNPYLKRLKRTNEEVYKRQRDDETIVEIIEALQIELRCCNVILDHIGYHGHSQINLFTKGTYIPQLPRITLHENPVDIIEYMEAIEKIIEGFNKSGYLDVYKMMELL